MSLDPYYAGREKIKIIRPPYDFNFFSFRFS